jgi:hypothetical protein
VVSAVGFEDAVSVLHEPSVFVFDQSGLPSSCRRRDMP